MDTIKKSAIPIIITSLLLFPAGLVLGQVLADDSETTTAYSEDTHSDDEDHSSSSEVHTHPLRDVAAEDAPKIMNLVVEKDAKAGWNVSFDTENFRFAPEKASSDHVLGEGHAHIYVDDEKLSRLYSEDYYIGHLDEGERVIRVTLNGNDHKDYAVDGVVVDASVSVVDEHHSDDMNN